MILLKKIKLTNFLSHRNTVIDFDAKETILIDGKSGAGKSSIFDAITWCLYGQGRASNLSLLKKGEKKGSVCLTIIKKHKQEVENIIITRSITDKNKHSLNIISEKGNKKIAISKGVGMKGNQEWIEKKLIGSSWLLFVNSIAYIQGNNDSFVMQTAQKRKDLLLEIVRAEDYKEYYKYARIELNKINNRVEVASGQIKVFNDVLQGLGDIERKKSSVVKRILEDSETIKNLQPKIAKLEEEKQQLCSTMENIALFDENLKIAESTRDFVKNILYERKQDIAEKEKLTKILKTRPKCIESLTKEKNNLKVAQDFLVTSLENHMRRNLVVSKKPIVDKRVDEIKRLESNLNEIKKEPVCPSGDKCPYTGNNINQMKKINEQLHKVKLLVAADEEKFNKWELELKKLPPVVILNDLKKRVAKQEKVVEEKKEKMRRLEAIQKELDNITGIENEMPELEKSLQSKERHVSEMKKKKKEAEKNAKPKELVQKDKELQEKKAKMKDIEYNIAESNTILKALDKDKKKADELKEQIKMLKKEISALKQKMKKIALIKQAFSPKGGIETLVIDYLLPRLEDNINVILSQLSDFHVRLDTQRDSATGKAKVEGLFITIINESNDELPYESYSGGEKVRITFAISEAFASLTKNKIGFRLVDEAVLALDENSLESFMNVVKKLLSEFNQTLFISHIQELKDLFNKKIIVKKNNNNSKIIN